MWVVKLGGSLFRSDHLHSWLKLLAEQDSLVVVPGGGPFADQVRQAQFTWRFDDATAHTMALLAMEQFGQMICGLQTGLVPSSTPSEIHLALARGETPVWMPSEMVLSDPGIRQSWDVTSDALSAWLCRELGAKHLLLVKSVRPKKAATSIAALTRAGIIDNHLGGFLQTQEIQAWIIHAEGYGDLSELADIEAEASIAEGLIPIR